MVRLDDVYLQFTQIDSIEDLAAVRTAVILWFLLGGKGKGLSGWVGYWELGQLQERFQK